MSLADDRAPGHVAATTMPSALPIAAGPKLTIPIGPLDHVRGAAAGRITLLEYGDYECPQCAQAYPIVQELLDKLSEELQFVFRHFPITSAHPHAQPAAEAAEWAAAQGRFWAMHDGLYRRRAKLSEGIILEVAQEIGLHPAGLRQAWSTHAHFQRVKDDFRGGLSSEVAGTPTFFIQGVRYDGKWDGENLEKALVAAAEAAD
jgi:protein-disulfide isomerase